MKRAVALLMCLALLCSPHTANAGSNTYLIISGPTTIQTGELAQYHVTQFSNSTECQFGAMNLYILARTALTETNWEADRIGMSFGLSPTMPGTMTVWAGVFGEDYCMPPGSVFGYWQWASYASQPFTITIEGEPILPTPTHTPTPLPSATATVTPMPTTTLTVTPVVEHKVYLPLVRRS